MRKLIITSILLVGLVVTGVAQSDKLKQKAIEKVEELNTEIIAGDASQALNEEQREQIITIHIDRIKAYRKARKAGASEEELKTIQKEYFQKIFKDILKPEQKKARNRGKKKS